MKRFILLSAVLLGLAWLPSGRMAHGSEIKEYDLKAVLLAKLPRFIEWPPPVVPKADPKPADKGNPKAAGVGQDPKTPPPSEKTTGTKPLPFKVGVLGKNPFGTRLESVFADTRIGGRPVQVVYFKTVQALKHVDLLYITKGAAAEAGKLRDQLAGKGTLLVGESTGFAREIGHINLYKRSGSIRFEANPGRLTHDKFKVSSKFLRLARIVKS